MGWPADTYTLYRIMMDGKEVHVGITTRPTRREQEHRATFGEHAYMVREGAGYPHEAALAWEAQQRSKGRPTGP